MNVTNKAGLILFLIGIQIPTPKDWMSWEGAFQVMLVLLGAGMFLFG